MGASGGVLEPAPVAQHRTRGSTPLNAAELMRKAERAAVSAKLLLEAGDLGLQPRLLCDVRCSPRCAACFRCSDRVRGSADAQRADCCFNLYRVKSGRV